MNLELGLHPILLDGNQFNPLRNAIIFVNLQTSAFNSTAKEFLSSRICSLIFGIRG